MRRILHPALVLASAVAVATCADAPTGPRNARTGSLLHGRVAVAAQLTTSARASAARLTQFGFAIDNVGIILRRVTTDAVVLDTTIAVTPGQTLSLALPVTVTTVDEQFIARVVMRQGTTVLYSGEHRVGATLDGSTTTPPPVVIEVEYAGPGASATRISITPRDSVFATTARPQFTAVGTDASGAVVPDVPIVWSTSDATMATVDPASGALTPGNRRGTVTLRALSLSGLTDTLPLILTSPPASIAIASGAGQTGPAGRSLDAPLVVQVLAADGLPAAGETVTFATTGTGSVTPATTTSDANGRASATIVLGAQLGTQEFTATVTGLPAVTAVQHAVAGAAASVVRTSADTARGVAGTALATPLSVQVRDEFGLPVAAALVRWTVSGAGGVLTSETSTASADGVATVGVTFGVTAGVSTVTAAAGDASTAFTLIGAPGSATQLVVVSGNGQQAPPSTALAPFVVRLADQHGNPVAGQSVSWTRAEGSGALATASSVSADDGQASVVYTTGTIAGPDRVIASAGGLEATFTATTQAGAAATLMRVSGDGQSVVAGTVIPAQLKARVTDAGGNGVASLVDVSVTAPGGATSSATGVATDTSGYVAIPLALLERPRVAGTYTAVVKLQASPTVAVAFTLTVVPAPAAAITIVAAPATAKSDSLLSPQPSLQLVDSLGNASPSAGIAIAATATGGATLSGTSTATTDSTGRATFTNLGLSGSGTTTITFSASGLASATRDVSVEAPPPQEPPPSPPVLHAAPAGSAQVRISQFQQSVSGLGVIVRDSANGPVAGVQVQVSVPPDNSQGTLGGTSYSMILVTDSSGTVLVGDWRPPSAPGTYTVTAQAYVNDVATGSPVALTAVRSTWTYALTASPASPVAGTSAEVSAALVDGSGVPVAEPGRLVAWTSSYSVDADTSATDQVGVARVMAATPPAPASITVSATDVAGVTGSITFSSRTAGGSVTVTPPRDTLTSIGDQRQLTAALRDSAGAPATGSFTWVSRNPAAVTVDGNGLATAVANGSAYIVATDIGGTSDSAIVVVQQRVASVQVAPGSLTLRLTGRQQFTAAAVDGRGNPIGNPVFSWASTVPTVASVDSTGAVEALSLGTAEIRATSSGITGVASLTVETPITRIAVGVDSAGTPVADGTPLAALGYSRRFIAVAYDTLDNPMSGVTFAWTSSNPSVAQLEATAAAATDARAAANGLTNIRATVHGVTGSAALTVQQALSGIQIAPASATIGVNGTVGTIARGVDANGYFISGGNFAFTSSNPAVATVGAASGIVTGVAVGSTTITATSGAITSSPGATITVSNSVPPVISFGRDTLSVGRGSSTSIPVFLSTPHASPVTVQLSVADTFAYFNPATVTFAANQTAVNANLVGRNAGLTTVHAVDASSTGFAGDTAALAVQATLRMAATSYSMNATDSRETQVLLSDPSPPGGTYVPLAFGTSGVATASPNPAFIPEGQLAADVVITGTSTSTIQTSTTIVPSAIGVNGTASTITVYPASLLLSTNFVRLGAGQYAENMYAYVSAYQTTPLTLTLTSSDTTVATVPATVTIPANSYYAYFRTSGHVPGSATISVSAPGWSSPTPISVQVTTPRVTVCCSASLTTTAPQRNITVYSTDSVGNAALRTNSLLVRIVSRDSSIMRAIDSTVTIAAGQYYSSAGRVIPGGAVGSTWVVVDGGGRKDSVQFTVAGPQLQWSSGTARIGAGQVSGNLYVYTPHNVTSPLELTITSSDSSIVATSTAAAIPAGTYYRYLSVRGIAPGTATLTVSAPGYSPATMTYVTTSPRISLYGGGNVNNFAPPRMMTVYTTDSTGNTHNRQDPLTVRLTASDTSVIKVDTTGTIAAGNSYNNTLRVTFVGTGTATVIAAADGHGADTVTYTVVTPSLSFSHSTFTLGAGQRAEPYVYTPDTRTSPLAVTFTETNGSVLAVTPVDSIPAGTYYRYFGIQGLVAGTDTIIATADGYRPDTLVVRVTTPRFTSSGLPGGRTTTSPPFQVTVYATDSLGSAYPVTDTVVVEVTSSDTTVIRPAARYVKILPNAYYTQPTITIVGPGSATLTFTDTAGRYVPHTTSAMTVTGPSLAMSHSTFRLGMGQTTGSSGVYVHVPNTVTEPLMVTLASTSTRVATVPPTVTIPAGSYYAYFEVVAGDTVGTIQVQATAVGYTPSAMNIQVTVPKFVISTTTTAYTTSSPRSITVYATDSDGATRSVREDVTVTLASSAPGVATVDSVTVTIPAGSYYSNAAKWSPVAVGTAQITARDDRAVYQKYTTGAANVAVTMPPLYFGNASGALGLGQYSDGMYVATNETQVNALTVTLSHAGTARTTTPASITIPAGSYYAYFRTSALSAGTDTLIASVQSPQHVPDTVVTIVGNGRIDPIENWPAALAVGDSVPVTIYARDPQQTPRYVIAATTWSLSHNTNIEFRSGNAAITSITIPANADRVTFYVKAVSAGTGAATITSSDYSTFTNSISVSP